MSGSVDRPCWCGGRAASLLGSFQLERGETHPLVRCDSCGVLALWPQPTDEELLRAYSSEYYGSSRRKFIGPIAAIVGRAQGGRARMAARLLKPGASMLDVGCGNGGFLAQMKNRGFDVQGTEWSAASAARIPAEAGIRIHVGDLLDLHLPAQTFDLITLFHVFEHVRRPFEILKECRRLLRPGGRLVLSMPNAQSRQAKRFGLAWFHHDPPRHLFGFGIASLTPLLAQAGFHVERINTFSIEQNPFGFIQSFLNRRRPKRDRLYHTLKGLGQVGMRDRIVDLAWLAILTIPALVMSTWESIRGGGATMLVQARLDKSAATPPPSRQPV